MESNIILQQQQPHFKQQQQQPQFDRNKPFLAAYKMIFRISLVLQALI